jgi:DNA-binding MarR family transcriptional regulator
MLNETAVMGGSVSNAHFRQSLSDDEKAVLQDLLAALECFRELRRDMPLQYVVSYLLVALEEGLGPTEYGTKIGVSQPVMSRHLLDIGDRNRNKTEGFGLITQRPDPMHLSKHQALLTGKGKALAHRLVRHLTKRRKDGANHGP